MSLINNSEERLLEIEKRLSELDFPSNLILELGSACNIRCSMCSNHAMTRPHGRMSTALYEKIINEIADGHTDARVWLCGYGEPLLAGKDELLDRITHAKNRGLENVMLNTNGTLMDDSMADVLIHSGLDQIVIALDAFSKDLYEVQKKGASRDTVYGNIINLRRKARQRDSKLVIEVQFVLLETNQHELEDFLAFWKQQGVKIKVREKFSWNRDIDHNASVLRATKRIACGWGLTAFPILWGGEAVNCGPDMHARNVWGNIQQQSIQEIWDKKRIGLVRPHLEHRVKDLPKMCRACTDWQIVGTINYDEQGRRFDVQHK